MAERITAWHALPVAEVIERQHTSTTGLTPDEAGRRLAADGPNRLAPPKKQGALLRFLRQFHNVLIYVLLFAALVTAMLGHWLDTTVILGVVLVNAFIGFIQEGRAEHALDAIRNLLSPRATVLREGRARSINAESLVCGDVVLLQSGDRVPADLRLLQQKNLRIDEALLTGESVPVDKGVDPVAETSLIADRDCMAWSGTYVTYGQGSGVVVATAGKTEIGRISGLLQEVRTLSTPLLRQLDRFGRWLSFYILLVSAATFFFGFYLRAYPATELFLAAVGIAVAAIPEGLPAILTITLAIGVQRMARGNAIIRRLPAVETLGSVTVICTDKTGTLTRNEMTVTSLVTADGLIEISGSGYEPRGSFSCDGKLIEPPAGEATDDILRAATLCNDAGIEHAGDTWTVHGDPTEGALQVLAMKGGLDPAFEQDAFPRIDLIPFESEHRFMATLHHDHHGNHFILVKGAPEKILTLCKMQRGKHGEEPLDPEYWQHSIEQLAGTGQRTLAIASKKVECRQTDLSFRDIEQGFTFLGITGITDPPREEVMHSITRCREAGIRVKMITGDHATTACAIGMRLGIGDGKRVLTGTDIEQMGDAALEQALVTIDIIARASPEHKLRLVNLLQRAGEIVAMTGDGVNDAPALKRANVGIAMGRKGTEVAREAAEMVLADDNFASISRAVEEGRTVYDNLRKSVLFILPTNGGEAMLLITAILLGNLLPITPVQILWVNMITTVTLALSLAFEPPEQAVMQRPPRNANDPLLSPLFLWRIVFVSITVVCGCFGLFSWYELQGYGIDYMRTVTVNTLVMFEVFYLFNTRHFHASVINLHGLFGNRYVLMAVGAVFLFQWLFTYNPAMQTLFRTVSLDWQAWLLILAVAFSIFVLVELEKYVLRRLMARNRVAAVQQKQD